MREILFRGKRADNDEWVEGAYLHLNTGNDYICDGTVWIGTLQPCKNRVISETVGQYTGLCDKNGKKIFEGDIVKTKFGRLCHVKWRSTGCFCGIDLIPLETKSKAPTEWDLYCSENLEVVGNVHDNPELLEVTINESL